MRLPNSAFLDPSRKQIDLLRGKRLSGFDRWHPIVFILCGDAFDERALFGMSGDDGEIVGLQFRQGDFFEVKAQASFAFACVRPVASVAVVGKDWANVPVEIDLPGISRGKRGR